MVNANFGRFFQKKKLASDKKIVVIFVENLVVFGQIGLWLGWPHCSLVTCNNMLLEINIVGSLGLRLERNQILTKVETASFAYDTAKTIENTGPLFIS